MSEEVWGTIGGIIFSVVFFGCLLSMLVVFSWYVIAKINIARRNAEAKAAAKRTREKG